MWLKARAATSNLVETQHQLIDDADRPSQCQPAQLLFMQVRREVINQHEGKKDEDEDDQPLQDCPRGGKRCAEPVTVCHSFGEVAAADPQRQRGDNQHGEGNRQQDGEQSSSPPRARLLHVVGDVQPFDDRFPV
jgi:hypothetical protein